MPQKGSRGRLSAVPVPEGVGRDALGEGRSLGEVSVSPTPGCKTEFWENFGVN